MMSSDETTMMDKRGKTICSEGDARIRDYLNERELQRLAVDEDSIVKRNAYIFGMLDEIRSAHPNIDPISLERIEMMSCYIDSILWLLDDYIEDLGTDAPPMVEHIQWDMSHLADDCKRLSADAYSASRLAQALVEHPRTPLG